MQELNVTIKVEGLPEEFVIDVAGFDEVSDITNWVNEEVAIYIDGLDEVDRSNLGVCRPYNWEVVNLEGSEADWVFEASYPPDGWLWGWVEYFGKRVTLEADVCRAASEACIEHDKVEEAYCGSFSCDEDFAQEYASSLGAIDADSTWPNNCIDWEWASRELMMDHLEHDGFYFKSLT